MPEQPEGSKPFSAEKSAEKSAASPKKKGMPSLVWMGGLALVIIVAAYLVVQFAVPATVPSSKEAEPSKPQPKMFRDVQTLPSFLVNLAGTGGKRYLKIGIAVEYETSNVDVIGKRFDERRPALQDRLIEILSALTLDKVNDPDNKSKLKEIIAKELTKIVIDDDSPLTTRASGGRASGEHETAAASPNDVAVVGRISKILFTDFVVQ